MFTKCPPGNYIFLVQRTSGPVPASRHFGNRHFGTVDVLGDVLGVDILGVDVLGVDISAPTPLQDIYAVFIRFYYVMTSYVV